MDSRALAEDPQAVEETYPMEHRISRAILIYVGV